MRKTVLTFGLISGVITSVLMLATLPFFPRIGFDNALYVGYTNIVLSFLLVFFGIRSYRDNVNAGTISFTKAFTVGILITVISCLFYVVTWEIINYKLMPEFGEMCANHMIEQARNSGGSPAEVAAEVERTRAFLEVYNKNVFTNAAITFVVEPLPVGLVVTLFSALVLRRKSKKTAEEVAVAATT